MISARSMTLGEAFELGHFEPAPVQREYQWTSKHAEALFDDIYKAYERLGLAPEDDEETIAAEEGGDPEPCDDARLKALAAELDLDDDDVSAGDEDDVPDGDDDVAIDAERLRQVRVAGRGRRRPPEIYNLNCLVLLRRQTAEPGFYVYDGLQRLTTLTILIAKLRHGARDVAEDFLKQCAQMLYRGAEMSRRRVEVETTGRTLADVVAGRTLRGGARTAGDNRMREVAGSFAAKFKDWSSARRQTFLDFLCNRVVVTVQVLEDTSLAYQTFVAANDRGLNLDVGDILKGELVELASLSRATADQIDTIADGWRKAQGMLHNSFREFVPAIEGLKFGVRDMTSPGERLLELFDSASSPADMAGWIEGEFAELTQIFALSRRHHFLDGARDTDLHLRRLSFLGWKEWQPVFLALGLAQEGQFDDRNWRLRIAQLYRASYTFTLLGWTKRRRMKYAEALDQLLEGKNPLNPRVKGGQIGALYFDPFLKGKAKEKLLRRFDEEERRGAIVRWIETLEWDQPVPRSCSSDAEIEHVLPQSPTKDWAKYFSDQDFDDHTNRLGNLCLLSEDVNRYVSNKGWQTKSAEYTKLRRRFKTVNSVLRAGRNGWTPAAIEARTQQMTRRAARALLLDPPSRR